MPICMRCGKETKYLFLFPFLYKMEGHPNANEDGYVQFAGCKQCVAIERGIHIPPTYTMKLPPYHGVIYIKRREAYLRKWCFPTLK